MSSHRWSQSPVGWCSLTLLLTLCIGQSHGQPPNLGASGTGQGITAMFVVYFINGTNTSDIGSTTLPQCLAGGSPTAIILEKVDGSLVIGQAAATGSLAGYDFDPIAHPVLTPRYTGLYRCTAVRTGGNQFSATTYQLNVVVPVTLSANESPSVTYNTTSATKVLTCNATGNQAIDVTWSSSVGLTSNTQQMPTSTPSVTSGTVSSTFSFAGNDSAISLGMPFNVSCSAHYQGVTCTNGTVPSVRANCIAALQAESATAVTALATECDRIIDLRDFTDANSSTPNTVGSVVTLGCMQGYNLTVGAPLATHDALNVTCLDTGEWNRLPSCDITHCGSLTGSGQRFQDIPGSPVGAIVNVNCQSGYDTMVAMTTCYPNGSWTSVPYCADIDECLVELHNCHNGTCRNTEPGFFCNCPDQDCTYTECGALNITGVEIIPRTNVNVTQPINVTVSCMPDFTNAGTDTITCQRDGNFSPTPNCTASTEAASTEGLSGSDVGVIVGCVVGALVAAIIVVCVIIYLKKRKGDGAKSLTDGSKGARPVPTAEDGVVPAIDEHELAALRQPRVDTRGPPPPDSDPTNTFEPGQRIPIGDHSRLLNDPRGGTGGNGDEGHYDAFVRDNQAAPQPAPPVDDSATYDHIVRPVNPDSGALPPMGPNSSYEQIRLPGEPAQQPAPNNPSPGADAAAEAAEPQPPDAQYAMVDLSKKSRR